LTAFTDTTDELLAREAEIHMALSSGSQVCNQTSATVVSSVRPSHFYCLIRGILSSLQLSMVYYLVSLALVKTLLAPDP